MSSKAIHSQEIQLCVVFTPYSQGLVLPPPPTYLSGGSTGGQGRGGQDPHLPWVSIPSPGTVPPPGVGGGGSGPPPPMGQHTMSRDPTSSHGSAYPLQGPYLLPWVSIPSPGTLPPPMGQHTLSRDPTSSHRSAYPLQGPYLLPWVSIPSPGTLPPPGVLHLTHVISLLSLHFVILK